MSNFFLWLGASISLAEIEAGSLFSGLILSDSLFAIFFGHFLGGILFFAMMYISTKLKCNAMGSLKYFYSQNGKIFFSFCNFLALICWSAVMIMSAAILLNGLYPNTNFNLVAILLSSLLIIWLFLKQNLLMLINNFIVFILFLIVIYIFYNLINLNLNQIEVNKINLINAIELSIAMPISWLALVGDYTKYFKNPIKDSLVASVAYFLGSSLMYIIGYLTMKYYSDLSSFLITLKLSMLIIFLIIFSTITTTYLDIFSANESIKNINNNFGNKITILLIIFIALLIAIFVPFSLYENFLYTLSSVFLPMASVMICVYCFKLKNSAKLNFLIWFIGFVIYQILIYFDFLASVLTFLIILILTLGGEYVSKHYAKNKKS